MTNDEIRIAIAESQGWTRYKHKSYENDSDQPWVPAGFDYDKSPYSLIRDTKELPNYTSDLNAMQEVEKTLRQDEQEIYWNHLVGVIWNPVLADYPDAKQTTINTQLTLLFSTARQRAEAYLRTKGLWTV